MVSFAGIWLLHLWGTMEGAYKTLVWPKLEYAVPVWSPYFRGQRRAGPAGDGKMYLVKKCLSPIPRMMIEPRPPGPKSDTLPCRCKSWLIQQGCTSVDKLHPTTYSSSILRFVPKFQRTFILDTDVIRAHQMGYLRWAPNVTGEKPLNTLAQLGIKPRLPGRNQTPHHVTVKAGSYRNAVQVLINYVLPQKHKQCWRNV